MLDWVKEEYRHHQAYVPGRGPNRKAEQEAVKLSSNENPYGPSPKVMQAARAALSGTSLYPDSEGRVLRTALAEHLRVGPEEVLLGNGSNDLLALVARVCLSSGDELLLVKPSFLAYGMAAAWAAADVREVALSSGHSNEVDHLLGAVTAATKMLFLANPNNPTGNYLNAEALQRLVRELPPHIVLVVDEAYFEYAVAADYPDATQLLQPRERMLVLRTFSKIYGLAGLRLGYGIGSAEFINCLHHARMPFAINCVVQAAAVAALEDSGHVAFCKAQNRIQMAVLSAALERLGLQFLPSQGNFLLVRFPQQATTVNVALEHRGLFVRPMEAYGLPSWQRITLGTAAQNARLIDALEAL